MGVRLRLLGPVQAWVGPRQVALGPRKQRLVFAVLALEANRPVELSRLVDLAWSEEPPPTAAHAIRVCVSALRSAFRDVPEVTIDLQGSGYVLITDPMNIDAHCFRSLLAQARGIGDDASRVALLDRALGLWAGPALDGAAAPATQQRLCVGLEDARLSALEDRLDAQLRLGRHHEVLDELAGLAAAHPLRERLTGQLMLALYRDGRSGEALDVFRLHREHVRDELGLDPGPALQELELAVLRNDAVSLAVPRATAAAPIPAQLPAVTSFTGRTDVLRALDLLLAERATSGPLTVISGSAGVGKTALAVHWAHRHRDSFPDGQLYVNLAGYAPGEAMPPIRALGRFLRALGVPAGHVPLEVDEASALYRSLLADRRVLVLLDNAGDPEQARPLLPGGVGCYTVVTSRDRLSGLTAREGARPIGLGVLPSREAHALLAALLEARHSDSDSPDQAGLADVAALCAYLPLALRIAGAHLLRHPHQSTSDLARALREGNRLTLLSVAGDEQSAVRAAFDLSYETLTPPTRRLFQLVGLHPGADLSAPAAAALAATTTHEAQHGLAELAGAHLVDEHADGRFALHDLLRLYARTRATEELSPLERETAMQRLYTFYLSGTDAAAHRLYPNMQRLPRTDGRAEADRDQDVEDRPRRGIEFRDDGQALGWLETERPNLVAVVATAATHGPHPAAWLLADALRGYFWMRHHAGDWLTVAHAGLAAAEAADDPAAMAAAHLSLAQAQRWLARYADAIDHLEKAGALAGRAGWLQGQAAVAGTLGNVYRDQARLVESAEHHRMARALFRRTGRRGGEATSLGNLGNVLIQAGRLPEATECLVEALTVYREIGARSAEAHMLNSLGCTYLVQGRLTDAHDHLEAALALHREVGNREGEADGLNNLAELHLETRRYDLARASAEASLALSRAWRDRRVEVDATNTLGHVTRLLADPGAALGYHRAALRIADETGYGQGETMALIGLAEAEIERGRLVEAELALQRALLISRQVGLRLLEGRALTALAAAVLESGRTDDAERVAREALAVHRECGDRSGQARALHTLHRARAVSRPVRS